MNKQELIKAIEILIKGYAEQGEFTPSFKLECGINTVWEAYCIEV